VNRRRMRQRTRVVVMRDYRELHNRVFVVEFVNKMLCRRVDEARNAS
jgi:hypothetical protein